MILGTSRELAVLAACKPYALVRGAHGAAAGARVLVPLEGGSNPDTQIAHGRFVSVSDEIDDAAALWLPPVAAALAIWEALGLELGEAAVVTGGHALSALVGKAALWHGATPVVQVGGEPLEGAEHVSLTDADAAAAQVRALTASSPGYAAVDLSGSAATIETLLATLPRWGRLHLVGDTMGFGIDFYNDMHRRGATITGGIFEPAVLLDRSAASTRLLARAARLMTRDDVQRITGTSQSDPAHA